MHAVHAGTALGLSSEDFAKEAWAHRIYIGMIKRGNENVATYDMSKLPKRSSLAQGTSRLNQLFATADDPNATPYPLQVRSITDPRFAGKQPAALRGHLAKEAPSANEFANFTTRTDEAASPHQYL